MRTAKEMHLIITMKKIYFFKLFLLSFTAFSQHYYFDYALKYDLQNGKEKSSRQFVVNSSNHDYKLTFHIEKNKSSAELMDFKNSVSHYFYLETSKFPLQSKNFKYLFSKRFPSLKQQFAKEDSRRFFTTDFIKNEEDISYYRISEFSKASQKRSKTTAFVKMKVFDVDLSAFGLAQLLDYKNAGKKIKFDKNLIMTEGEMDFEGVKYVVKLNYVEPQNFTIEIQEPIFQ